jgi:hypothetical protein
MLNLQQRLTLLFPEMSTEHVVELTQSPFGTLRNTVSSQLRTLIGESSALGLEDLEDGKIKLSSLHKELKISQTVDLLQINRPIVVRLTLTPVVDDVYSLRMGLWLTDPQSSYIVEHHVIDFTVESVQEQRIHKRVERMLSELHRFAAPVIAG